MKKEYYPSPADVSDIVLPEELIELTELIAENVHENWAKGRVEEGWTFGKEKDSVKKETPCLVSYSELDESEKEFDRRTAMETLKLIVKLGYKIEKE